MVRGKDLTETDVSGVPGNFEARAEFSYRGPINQDVIEHLVDCATTVGALLRLSAPVCSKLVQLVIEQCQNIAEHAADSLLGGRSAPNERPGEVIIGHDGSGVYLETRCEVRRDMVASLARNYDHLRGLSDDRLEIEYSETLSRRVTVPGELGTGMYTVARCAAVGADGKRRISVTTEGNHVDSKVYVN